MLISAADRNVTETIRNSAIALGINEDDIYFDVMPWDMLQMGLDEKTDFFNFLHRAVLFDDPAEEDLYINNPPLEFLRITPNDSAATDFFPIPELRTRGTGSTEFHLNDGLEQLRQQIINRYIADYDTINLTSYQWIPEGYEAIETRFNARAENRDALYLRTPFFQFKKDDIIVVFGANHAKTNKATYCNAGIVGAQAVNGLGGVNNLEFQGTAREFLADSSLADSFYVWKFARTAIDAQTYVVSPDLNQDYTGINYGALALMVFRSYVEPETKVGPAAAELIMDQTILFRPKSVGVENDERPSHNDFPELNIYPNPFNSQTVIQFTLPAVSDLNISIFNIQGQLITKLFSAPDFSGSKRISWEGIDSQGTPLSTGVYLMNIIYYNVNSNRQNRLIKKVLLIR
jgi:hypothetical protein